MPPKKVLSKVDERIKAAEARRAELQRQRELELKAAAERRKRGREHPLPVAQNRPQLLTKSQSLTDFSTTATATFKRIKREEQAVAPNVARTQENNKRTPSMTQTATSTSFPQSPSCQCQQTLQENNSLNNWPRLFTPTGEFIPGRFLKCNGKLIPICQHRPWLSFKRQVQKLFTIKHIEELLRKGDHLDLVAVLLDILRRSCSSRHPIQNKFLQLQSKLMALERSRAQLEMRRSSVSISPLESPKLSCNLNDLRSPGSSMEALTYKDSDGLLSTAVIDEITARHNLSPTKSKMSKMYDFSTFLLKTPIKAFQSAAAATSAPGIDAASMPRSVSEGPNFKTVLSPRKYQLKGVDAQTVLTPLRKSGRTAAKEGGGEGQQTDFTEENVTELLLQDESIAYVANPYIKSSPTKRNSQNGKRA